jgi:putative signal transducing protein
MKLLTKNSDTSYLHTLKGLLEENGIPASISGENTARMITPFLMTQPCLWVYLDEQLEEASKLINNHEYIVENKIDVEEFYNINKEILNNSSSMNSVYIRLGLTVFGWLAAAFAIFFILVKLTT